MNDVTVRLDLTGERQNTITRVRPADAVYFLAWWLTGDGDTFAYDAGNGTYGWRRAEIEQITVAR